MVLMESLGQIGLGLVLALALVFNYTTFGQVIYFPIRVRFFTHPMGQVEPIF